MVGRIPKRELSIMIDNDDYLWARLHGFEFSKRFREYLKMVRREVEISSYGLILMRRSEPASSKTGNGK
jgi:hypothetical protein